MRIDITETLFGDWLVIVNGDLTHELSTVCKDNLRARDAAINILEEMMA